MNDARHEFAPGTLVRQHAGNHVVIELVIAHETLPSMYKITSCDVIRLRQSTDGKPTVSIMSHVWMDKATCHVICDAHSEHGT